MQNHVISQNPLHRLVLSIDFCREPHGACKIEDLLYADRKVGAKSLADGYQWGKQGVGLESPVPMDNPRLSPDGQQILFMLPPWRKGELMVINLDGTGLRKLLADPPRPVNTDAEWSPDGKWIVYQAYHPDLRPTTQLYVTDAQGLNSFQIAADLEANMYFPFWFPDSKRIGFTVGKWGAKLHWVDADPNAKAREMNHRFFAYLIRWSPNGKRTIVRGAVEENGIEGLFLGDAPARNLVRLNDEASLGGAQWLPDNEHIVGTSGQAAFRCGRSGCRGEC